MPLSGFLELLSKRADRPGRAAAAEKVVVAGKDPGAESESDRGPVVRIAWHTSARRGLQALVA